MTQSPNITQNETEKRFIVEKIQNSLYTLRGQQIMLDCDLAEIYGYTVKTLNQQVKRNIGRFPDDFMFQLNPLEIEQVKSQIVTSPTSSFYSGQNGGRRKPPYAFTEQGIYMLATVLHGELAEQQSIFIMRAFRQMRKIIEQNKQIISPSEFLQIQLSSLSAKNNELEQRQNKTDVQLQTIQKSIEALNNSFISDENMKTIVIYNNQKFEADAAYVDIFLKARKTIFLIDDYVNHKTLQLLSHKRKNVDVIIFTDNKGGRDGRITDVEIADFNSEYPNLSLRPNRLSHDRFIILDYNETTEEVYHCGASVKDAGNKVCGINKIQEISLIHPVILQLLKE